MNGDGLLHSSLHIVLLNCATPQNIHWKCPVEGEESFRA
jgi:hypothetical protein